MERKIIDVFLTWKRDNLKKPMLLYGPKGCGKTYSVVDYGTKEYKNIIYFNASNNFELNYVLDKNTTVDKVIRGLAAISLETILREESLIVFDDVSLNVIGKISTLFTGNSQYHIIMITSSKDIVDASKKDNIAIKTMNYVTFPEYLKYIGKEQLIDFIVDSFKTNSPMPFHALAFESFNNFLITGGYPNIITSIDESNLVLLNSYLTKSTSSQKETLLSLNNLIDIKRGIDVYDNIFVQLIKENKKFQYGLLKQGGRKKEYDSTINFMTNNDIIIKCNKINEIKAPLSKYKDEDSFKLYYTDSGILLKKLEISYNKLITNDKYMYLLYENNVATSLKQNGFNLYYYQSGGKAEIDFLIQTRTGKLIPIELIKKDIAKSKSLKMVINKYELQEAIRIGEDNFKMKNGIKYIPFYATFCITEMM